MEGLLQGEPLHQAGNLGKLLVNRLDERIGARHNRREPPVAKLLGQGLHLRERLMQKKDIGLGSRQSMVADTLELLLQQRQRCLQPGNAVLALP